MELFSDNFIHLLFMFHGVLIEINSNKELY